MVKRGIDDVSIESSMHGSSIKKGSRMVPTLRAYTVKMLNAMEPTEYGWNYRGVEVLRSKNMGERDKISVVGLVKHFSNEQPVADGASRRISFELQSLTGPDSIPVKALADAMRPEEVNALADGNMVHIKGHLQKEGKKSIKIWRLMPVNNLSTALLHLVDSWNTSKTYVQPFLQPSATPYSNTGAASSSSKAVAEVKQALINGDTALGVEKQAVIDQLKTSFTELEIMAAFHYLENEGFIYSTIDEFHFKSIDV